MSRYGRKRSWRNRDGEAGVDVRHERGEYISDDFVEQVSPFEWRVTPSGRKGSPYRVTQEFEEEEFEDLEDHLLDCDYSHERHDPWHKSEDFCYQCDICSEVYDCNCPDEHPICKHVHKVHMFRKQVLKKQKPYTVDKTIKEGLEKLQQLSDKMTDVEKKVAFCKEVQDLVQRTDEV